MNNHLVERVPEAVRRLLGELLAESVQHSIQGEPVIELQRMLTLYHNTPEVRAELTITLALKVRDSK